MLRRGGAFLGGPSSSQHYNSGGGGGSPEKGEKNQSTTAKAFSYIRTEFGALRSRRLAVNPVGN